MSVGSDIVGEVIALLQSVYDDPRFEVNIREYGGELDDKGKDPYALPTTLYVESGPSPVTTILVEYAGVEFDAQDTTHLVYFNTYKVNVWIVAGYSYSKEHKEGGAPLQQEEGYALCDAVLDKIVGHKLLKDAETVKLDRSARVFYGINDPVGSIEWDTGDVTANVYKLGFSFRAQSVWDEQPSYVGEHWFTAAGPVVEEGGFTADLDVLINPVLVDFSERAVQDLPNERIDWRSAFPDIPLPTALFPCHDPETNTDKVVDVVDGITLEHSGSPVLHRRMAAGLYGLDYRGAVRFNPRRALEFTADDSKFAAEDGDILNPVEDSTALSVAGFVVARLRPQVPDGDRVLVSKWQDSDSPGWRLVVKGTTGNAVLEVQDNSSPWLTESAVAAGDHAMEHWIGILFSVDYSTAPDPTITVRTPHGVGENSCDLDGIDNTESIFTIGEITGHLSGAVGQIALAAYWQGAGAEGLNTADNFAALWKGVTHPVDATGNPGLTLRRDRVIGCATGNALGTGEAVCKFWGGAGALSVPQDPFLDEGGGRMLPHGREWTNLLADSEDFTAASWTVLASPVLQAPSVTGPDGLLSAFELHQGDELSASGGLSGSPPDALVFSIWARSGSGGTVTLGLDGAQAVHALTPRWTRVSVVQESPGSGDVSITIGGDEDSAVEIWGAQLEAGPEPAAYIPTSGGSASAKYSHCKADWTVLTSPPAHRGKVRITLLPGAELLTAAGHFVALEVRDASNNYLQVWGEPGVVDDEAVITWHVDGSLPSGAPSITAPEAVPLDTDTDLVVAVRWHRDAVELWVDSELVGKTGTASPAVFADAPTACYLMQNQAGDEETKWIGTCKEVRWWK